MARLPGSPGGRGTVRRAGAPRGSVVTPPLVDRVVVMSYRLVSLPARGRPRV
jgi:hypothetical protein